MAFSYVNWAHITSPITYGKKDIKDTLEIVWCGPKSKLSHIFHTLNCENFNATSKIQK